MGPEQALAAVYDGGAAAYDQHWAPALHRHARALVEALPSGDGRTVLDIGGGAGTLLPALQCAAGPHGRVVLLDRSRGMLRRAASDLPRVQADATRLPVAAKAADIAVFAFILFLLPDARAALTEAARVLRPNGWVLAATWGRCESIDADDTVRDELDQAGAPPFPALPRSDEVTNSPQRMVALLESASFTGVRTEQRPFDTQFDSDSVLAMRTGCGALGWRYARLGENVQTEVSRRIYQRLAALPPDAFVDRSEVLLTWARSR